MIWGNMVVIGLLRVLVARQKLQDVVQTADNVPKKQVGGSILLVCGFV